MSNAYFDVPLAINETVKSYAPGSPERIEVEQAYFEMLNGHMDIPMYIGSNKVTTSNKHNISPPHELKTIIGEFFSR